jgi:pimeloyl-ACP methyl ester carboxylesterase
MKKLEMVLVFTLISLFLSCQSLQIKTDNPNMPANAYLDGGTSTVGVILCHGRGQHPTWRVVNPLRKGIHEQLGYHTLSLQMPTGGNDWRSYKKYFPDAYKRIEAAIQVLRNEKGVRTIYLMGHSMGSRMATGYLSENPESNVSGFIGVGVVNSGGIPLDSLTNLKIALRKSPDLKVLDVYGDGGDGEDAKGAKARSFLVSDRYRQVMIPGADHQFLSGEKQMVNAVINWLKEQK